MPDETTDLSKLLAAAAARTVPVVRGIGDDQLGLPTPCAEFAVRDLLNHLYLVVVNFQALASGGPADFGSTPDRTGDADWRGGFAVEAGRLVEAWAGPGALEGVSPVMGIPQTMVGDMVLLDLTVHGWDLARATGQDYEPDPAAVAELRPMAEQLAPTGRQRGVFGAEATAGPDAGEFDRLLAITGRAA